jgi:hypothetical protein
MIICHWYYLVEDTDKEMDGMWHRTEPETFILYPENGGNAFLFNVGTYVAKVVVSRPTRH